MRHQLRKPKGRKYFNLIFTDSVTGKRVKKSTGCELKGDAEAWTHRFVKTYEPGQTTKAVNNQTTVGQLVENFLEAQKVTFPVHNKRTRSAWEFRMKDKFAHIIASELKGRDTLTYINWCVGVDHPGWPKIRSVVRNWRGAEVFSEAPLSKAQANRDIAILQGAYTHARKVDDYMFRPNFSTHDEGDNVREGFLYQWEFDAVSKVISDLGPDYLWLRGFLETAYELGNRKGELQKIRVHQVHRFKPLLTVDRMQAKTKKTRLLGLSNDTYQLLRACCAGKSQNDYVFTRKSYSQKQRAWVVGPVGDFRRLWLTILRSAGIERDVLIHDFRRSAVNNMIQSGADRDEIKNYSGHADAHNMISRYHIVREESILAVAVKNEERKRKEREAAAELGPNWAHKQGAEAKLLN